jgi:hypothetical protein
VCGTPLRLRVAHRATRPAARRGRGEAKGAAAEIAGIDDDVIIGLGERFGHGQETPGIEDGVDADIGPAERDEMDPADYDVRHRIWETQIKAIEKQFKQLGAAGSAAHRAELINLGPAPQEPIQPLLMSAELTYEGMVLHLDRGQPIYGIIGSEGGQFVGGHGMADDAKMRTAAGLSPHRDASDGSARRGGRGSE